MSNAESPVTVVDSRAGTLQPESTTVPSSPMTELTIHDPQLPDEKEINDEQTDDQNGDSADDIEDMNNKSNALMHLLKTSSVFVAIMADRMKKQTEEARQKSAKKQRIAAEQAKTTPGPAPTTRRETRNRGRQDQITDTAEDTSTGNESAAPAGKRRGRPKRNAGVGANAAKNGTISAYFEKAEVKVTDDNPTVQEALAQAADEYEENPTALGEQELVATQQPGLVTGGKMRTYQLEGLEWLKSLWMNGLCGILADEMGLGKTVQAISMIAFMKENNISGPFLIAGPLSTTSNWVNEFKRWTPGINTVLYHGNKNQRAAIRNQRMKLRDQEKMDFPVVCTSYEICMNDRKFLAGYKWRYIIVDEGHRLKNMNCRLIKELLTYNSANRLLITGTPLQNNIKELWSLLHFLLPDVFNDLDNFESWFDFSSVLDNGDQAEKVERRKRNLVTTMHSILKPFLLRRVKTDVENSLPKKREYILYAPLTSEQKELYREILNGTGRQYLESQALQRLVAKSGILQSQSLKRRRESLEADSPNKSARSSRSDTPASMTSSGRRRRIRSYKEPTDSEIEAQLRRIDQGEDLEEDISQPSESELEDAEMARNIKLAKKEIGQKKLQNPILQARLACNSPHNFYWPWQIDADPDETLVSASGKMQLLDRLVSCLLQKGHKILIFSQFKVQLDIIHDYASLLRSWNCCRIDGAIAQEDRQAQIEAFNHNPDYKIFLLSTRAGGQGINLTAADTVILFDSDWNPQQDLQAQDRAHRIGQTKPVIVYRLTTKGTVEQTLLEKADSKRRLERLVIQKGKFRSLLDSDNAQDAEEIRKAFGDDEFERFEAGADPASILSDKELEILTDRSEEAYERAEKGLDRSGAAFVAVETKRDGESLTS
ncbi:SNF2-related protein [Penicillium hispanicum]|uniref:SNF2-related protein n=1 Tax=Penicillium hispanicum TaxID=1080232 RepID=UPI00254220BC|nr:SNF2-related protein [Penicillium hispanicum]KAJ5578280.1 SNF2-related protein [Penicillium hispanicum]